MRQLLMLAAFALLMFGVSKFAKWGIHEVGPLKFSLIAFPLIFLGAYLFDRRWGGGGGFW